MFKKILIWTLRIIVGFVVGSVVLVAVYAVFRPPLTPLMLIRVVEGWFGGPSVGIEKQWKPYEEISPNVFKALIAAEDGKFFQHDGFDWKAIEQAKKRNEKAKGKKLYGASTISMQTAKNVFLWHGRNYVRKGLEAYFTVLIEAVWGKRRILEVYANVIEWGPGIYGVEAAAQTFFKKSAKDLTAGEAALLVAVIPNPRKWSPAKPTGYITKRRGFILARMNSVSLNPAQKPKEKTEKKNRKRKE
ncbi:MAG: monofunctional biosynthetic peptidoglycan transglycosylase [Candidatus Kapabacteria bacterium]|nr:monofunctional biosynthetic peptidoglycan transglycosylase [Candidatus Kapabacteria bacterium]